MNWHEYFFEMCDITLKKSKDNSTQVGAVIVNSDHSIISTGYNDFPRGAIDEKDKLQLPEYPYRLTQFDKNKIKLIESRRERPLKYKWTEHGERNAIYNAARHGIALKGCEIYVHCTPISLPCCTDCTRAIIQAGLIKVHYKGVKDIPDRWKEDCEISTEMFKECGVEVVYHE